MSKTFVLGVLVFVGEFLMTTTAMADDLPLKVGIYVQDQERCTAFWDYREIEDYVKFSEEKDKHIFDTEHGICVLDSAEKMNNERYETYQYCHVFDIVHERRILMQIKSENSALIGENEFSRCEYDDRY